MSTLTPVTNLKGAPGQASTGAAADVAALLGYASQSAMANGFGQYLETRFGRTRNSIIDVGNSIAANGTVSFLAANSHALQTGQICGGDLSYMAKGVAQTDGRFRWLGTGATPGAKMQAIHDSWLADALASPAVYVHLQVVTNDFNPTLTGTMTLPQLKQAYQDLFTTPIMQAGKIPIITSTPPIAGASNAAPDAATRLLQRKINTWLRWLAGNLRVPFVDYYAVLVDPVNGAYKTGYSTDGVHPTNIGATAMGKELARVLNALPKNAHTESVLATTYSPSLLIPDAITNSTGTDKMTLSGSTGAGWSYGIASSSDWKTPRAFTKRNGTANISFNYPVGSGVTLQTGHRIRCTFAIDVPYIPAGATWTMGLFDLSTFQFICGTTSDTQLLTKGSKCFPNTASITTGANTVTCPAGTFDSRDLGRVITVVNGPFSYFPADTRIRSISNDGAIAYCTANATTTSAAIDVFVHHPDLCYVSHEFTVDASQNGHAVSAIFSLAGAANIMGSVGGITVEDLTALEVV